MKKIFFSSLILLTNLLFSQTKKENYNLIDFYFDSLLIKEIPGKIYSENISKWQKENAQNVKLDVYENDSNLVESLFSDSKGNFILRKLNYEKYYVLYFTKDNYFERRARIYTTGVEDSIKHLKFKTLLGTSLRITLFKIPKNGIKNPFDYDIAVLYYKKPKSELIAAIKEDEDYKEFAKKKDDEIIRKFKEEYIVEQKENIDNYIFKLKLEQVEKEKLNQQKIISNLTLKNKEAELNKKNIEASSRQMQIASLQQKNILSEENIKQQRFIQKLILSGLGLLVLFSFFIIASLRKTRKANKIISEQKLVVEKQKELADSQKHEIQEKQKEIIESITYAKRLQEAILPPQEFINQHFKNNFILYKPKDIVAGDFYWSEKIDDLFFIAAADSTGHGVPGAMVSVVCSNALNRAVKEFKLLETGKILDKTRELVLETFEKSSSEVKDGMDISLLCIDTKNKKTTWSGANNPLWFIQNNELKEIKPDKQPIGKTEQPKPFTTHQIECLTDTTFYLFTDGFADQFGGEKGKKFKYKPFAEKLLSIQNLEMEKQKEIINQTFEEWKGNLEQVDDVCVIGVRV